MRTYKTGIAAISRMLIPLPQSRFFCALCSITSALRLGEFAIRSLRCVVGFNIVSLGFV